MENFRKKIEEHKYLAVFVTLIVLLKTFVLLKFVGDKDWEPDSYMHFLQLKTVYYDFPNNLPLGLGVWAKPLYIYITAIPIYILGAKTLIWHQLFNLSIFVIIYLLIYDILQTFYHRKAVSLSGVALAAFSYLLFRSSISALTEAIFTLSLILGFYFAVKKKPLLAAFVFGLSVLGRIEGLFFLGVFNLWLVYKLDLLDFLIYIAKTRPASLVKEIYKAQLTWFILKAWTISLLPVMIWNFFGFQETGKEFFIFDAGYPKIAGIYGYGSWLDFPRMLTIQEPLIFALFLISIPIFIKRFKFLSYRKDMVLTGLFFAGFTFSQMYLWVTGKYGSAGLLRYLTSVIPFAIIFGSIAIVYAVEYFENHSIKYKNLLRYFVLTILLILQSTILYANIAGLGPISPKWIRVEPELIEAGEWIKENVPQNKFVASIRPEVIYYAQRDGDVNASAQDYRSRLLSKQPGVYVWSTDWAKAFNLTYDDMKANSKEVKNFNNFVYIFEI